MKVSRIAELKKVIVKILHEVDDRTFPKTLIYNRSIESPKYRITIDEIEEDFFIDSKGIKWVKFKEEPEQLNKI